MSLQEQLAHVRKRAAEEMGGAMMGLLKAYGFGQGGWASIEIPVGPNTRASIKFIGTVTRVEVDRLIAYLQAMRDSAPTVEEAEDSAAIVARIEAALAPSPKKEDAQ